MTKLSLLLKVLEGESQDTLERQMKLFKERALPDLGNNIKCGNSLIGPDFYQGKQMDLLNDDEMYRINPFDWDKEFPEIMKQGGFDAVIGNPPYVQPNILDEGSQSYLVNHFKANTDLYSIFIERSLQLLKDNSPLSFIVPSLFLKGVRYESLRSAINSKSSKVEVKEYGDGVFDKVKMPTCVIILAKGKPQKQQDYFLNKNQKLFHKIKTITLKEISETRRGLEIGKDKLLDSGSIECITGGNLDRYSVFSSKYISKDTFKSFSKNSDIFSAPKIIVRETGNKFFATIDYSGVLTTRSIYNTKISNKKYSPEFILGIINSSLFQFYFLQFIAPNTNIFPKIRIVQLKELPMPKEPEKNLVSAIEKSVDQLLQLNKEKAEAKTPDDKTRLQRQIDATDKQIDQLVYELYGLTEEEIRIVEGR